MIDPTLSLDEYCVMLADCERAIRANRRKEVLRKLLTPIFCVSIFAFAVILISGVRDILIRYWWAAIPLCIFLVVFLSTTKISLSDRDNAFSRLLDSDYSKAELCELKNLKYHLEYCIVCRKAGKKIEPSRLMVSVY